MIYRSISHLHLTQLTHTGVSFSLGGLSKCTYSRERSCSTIKHTQTFTSTDTPTPPLNHTKCQLITCPHEKCVLQSLSTTIKRALANPSSHKHLTAHAHLAAFSQFFNLVLNYFWATVGKVKKSGFATFGGVRNLTQ